MESTASSYNQYRPYNQIGWDLAKELDIECIVLELGLLRPDLLQHLLARAQSF